ncbi:5346_t:CDS:2 [Dentiscutata heterogama]|uniref:5346_t:CDS:1 n=1 Tax=Dentiscutata heterogama TaxID=1316150 RepID=A0ACA9K7T2_9GLOM|nr:5346_t:CDS:2 [Dentiscutata heterogama]
MEDAPYDYKILTRPREAQANSISTHSAGQETKLSGINKTFEAELQAYEDLKIREETSEDWVFDENSGYYYSRSAQTYALWDSHNQEWMYFDSNSACDPEKSRTNESTSISNKEHGSEDATDGAREEGQLSDSETCGVTSLPAIDNIINEPDQKYKNISDVDSVSHHVGKSEEQNTRIFSPPQGYVKTSEAQYFFHPESNIWFDVYSGVYSAYDESTQTYTPVDPSSIVYTSPVSNEDSAIDQGEPGSDATLRLVVMESGILKSGHLVLVDANGISMGRDRWDDRRLRLAEMPTSKHHCQIYCSSSTAADAKSDDDDPSSVTTLDTFFIVDIGSQNGTFVNSKRLSESKMSSKPHQLCHLDELVVGSTKFQVHLHKQWTCDVCTVTEGKMIDISQKLDGNANHNKIKHKGSEGDIGFDGTSNNINATQKELLEFQRREELNRLKRKYMGQPSVKPKHTKYVDRAAIRREIHPDNSPIRKDWEDISRINSEIEVNVQTKIGSENRGNKLLQKMGWKEGQGLGCNGTGILDPVQLVTNEGTKGLGASANTVKNPSETLQEATRRVAKERFIDLFQ